ncbi:hypothetical protein NLJ89_g1238 [Agrocybe chaxingu]|uniref:T6SS Phospholipase effector Tle1-like catalytic domain-containing protein n=1 Tax=Agrocybe chaxingu TaxID=84603 RepID=A0A9W8N0C2_9AGAR|nr:hypothetical protein NLJ89_g1238 [Agrocybe chaxingu]
MAAPGRTASHNIALATPTSSYVFRVVEHSPNSRQRNQRLARSVHHEDKRFHPAIPQIVFYQSGVGTENNFYSEYIEGTTGGSLADKVEEAYAFVAHNYDPGDEIFLFGFSRGAYTARMVAMFIGEIGLLDRKDMDNFAKIFINFQNLGKCKNPIEKRDLKERLAPWRDPESNGKRRADIDGDKFTVKFLGVWDTVGALGLPEEIPFGKRVYNLFGFPDRQLGEHVQYARQALALDEMRLDFLQVWFAGSHTDIGGGYKKHDLSDLSLIWMASEVGHHLGLDVEYLTRLVTPVAPWGTQQPHDSATGIFFFASTVQRDLPVMSNNPETQEFIHPSVLHQTKLNEKLSTLLKEQPDLICALGPLEEEMQKNWPYDKTSEGAREYAARLKARPTAVAKTTSWMRTFIRRSISVSQSSSSVDMAPDVDTIVVTERRKDARLSIPRSRSQKRMIG